MKHLLGESHQSASVSNSQLESSDNTEFPTQVNSVSTDVHRTWTMPESRHQPSLDVPLNSAEQAGQPSTSSLLQIAAPFNMSKTIKKRKGLQPNVLHEDTFKSAKSPPKQIACREIAMKPAIASCAGTARSVTMSKRPQPPAKPRSEELLSAGGSVKNHTQTQLKSGEKKKSLSTRNQRSAVMSRGHLMTTSSSEESVETSEESTSDELEQNGQKHRKVSKKKKRQVKRRQQGPASSENSRLGSPRHSSATSAVLSVKSVAELLEEARHIAAEIRQDADHQRAPEKRVSETEIITSRQSPSKLMIKEPMEKELGDVDITDKEVSRLQRQVVCVILVSICTIKT